MADCGQLKPGTYSALSPLPICILEKDHAGMHKAERSWPEFIPRMITQWSDDGIVMQNWARSAEHG